jgi:hypothetical protein
MRVKITVKNRFEDSPQSQTRVYPNVKDSILALMSLCADDFDAILVIAQVGKWTGAIPGNPPITIYLSDIEINFVGVD